MNSEDLFYQPRINVLKKIEKIEGEPEMTESESAFLCGLIKKYKPKRILEVGVAAGGTTAIILECIKLLNISHQVEMFSIDILEKFYKDNTKDTGFLAAKISEEVNSKGNIKHKFFLGKILPEIIDSVGDEIDFVILDTVHAIPGELLDFPVLLRYLSKDAIFVLHDIGCHIERPACISNQVLWDSVVGEKIIMCDDSNTIYPNIGAIKINNDTYKYIDSVFHALTLPWQYIPSKEQLQIYELFYKQNYNDECNSIFIKSAMIGENTVHLSEQKITDRNKMLLIEYVRCFNERTKKNSNFVYDDKYRYAFLPISEDSQIHYEIFMCEESAIISLHFENNATALSGIFDDFKELYSLNRFTPIIKRDSACHAIFFECNNVFDIKTVSDLLWFLIKNTIDILVSNKLVGDNYILQM